MQAKRINTLKDFIAASEADQLSAVYALSRAEAVALHNTYFESPGCRCSVLGKLLERANPEEYLESNQDLKTRRSLMPSALAKIRSDTYEAQLRPLLTEPADVQEAFLRSLSLPEREALLKLLDRYAREYGRSNRCREFETRIKEMK